MFRETLERELSPYLALSGAQLDLLGQHHSLLSQWNATMNLTRIINLEDMVRLHYCESLFLGRFLPIDNLRIIDVGSGAGFPGIPIAILRPEFHVELLESRLRKAVFLREAVRGINNATVATLRAEELIGRYDWIVSRGVAPAAIIGLQLAPNTALLIGGRAAGELEGVAIRSPWGNHRVMFHVKHAKI